jgi:hypothetical protein
MSDQLESLVANMTVGQLAELAGLTIAELVQLTNHGATVSDRKPRTVSRKPAPKAAGDPRGNKYARAAAYTQGVLAVVRRARGPISFTEIRAGAGGTITRCRLAVARLVDRGDVEHDGGATSARRYWAV